MEQAGTSLSVACDRAAGNSSRRPVLPVIVFAALAATVIPSQAGIVLGSTETWSAAPSLAGWDNVPPIGTFNATLSNPGAGGAGPGEGYLRITFSDQGGGPPAYEEDTAYADGSGYTGSYWDATHIKFSFYAEDVLPLSSVLYLHGAVSGNTWEFAFNNTMAGVWQEHAIPLNYESGWSGPGDAADFLNDLANVEWIGVNVARALNTMQQDFGIDNWGYYYIPEPGSIYLLASALLALGTALRRKPKEAVRLRES